LSVASGEIKKIKFFGAWENFAKIPEKESFSCAFFKKHTRIKALGAGAF